MKRPVDEHLKINPVILVTLDKKNYYADDLISVKCLIKNDTGKKIVLLWDKPRFRTWISGSIDLITYGWETNIEYIEIKPDSSVQKSITITQNKNIPFLDSGNYTLTLNFKFSGIKNQHLSSKTEFQLVGDSKGMTVKSILRKAQIFLKESISNSKSTEKINPDGVEIRDSFNDWSVSFSNEGPKNFGTTTIVVNKQSGRARFPIY